MSEKKVRAARRGAREASRKASATTFYLDTSSIRTAGKNLTAAIEGKAARTSMFTIVELLNGIRKDENNFQRRRGTLKNLITSGIRIDWRLRDTILLSSFGVTTRLAEAYQRNFSPKRRLIGIINLAINSSNVESFRQGLNKDLETELKISEEYDDELSVRFRRASEEGYKKSKKVFDDAQAGLIPRPPSIPPDMSLKEWSEWWVKDHAVLNRSITISALAEDTHRLLSEYHKNLPTQFSAAAIHDSFNFKLEVFVEAHSVRDILAYGRMNLPERNDGADLENFYYLDKNTVLVTEDEKQKNCATNIKLRVQSIKELKNALR